MGISQSKYDALEQKHQKSQAQLRAERNRFMMLINAFDSAARCTAGDGNCALEQRKEMIAQRNNLGEYVNDLTQEVRASFARGTNTGTMVEQELNWIQLGHCKKSGDYAFENNGEMVTEGDCTDPNQFSTCFNAGQGSLCEWDIGTIAKTRESTNAACDKRVADIASGKEIDCDGSAVTCESRAEEKKELNDSIETLTSERDSFKTKANNKHILGDGGKGTGSDSAFYCKFRGGSELQLGYDSGVAGLCEYNWKDEKVSNTCFPQIDSKSTYNSDNHPAYGDSSVALQFDCDNIQKLMFMQPDSNLDGECLAVDANDNLMRTTITTKSACDAEDRHTWVARDHMQQLARAKMKKMQDEINRLYDSREDATKVCYNGDTLDYFAYQSRRSEAECTDAGGTWGEWNNLVGALYTKVTNVKSEYECVKCDTNPEANAPYWDDSCEVVRGDNPSAPANKSECATKGGVWKKRVYNEQGKVNQKYEQVDLLSHAMCQVTGFRQKVPACGAATVEERAAGAAEKYNLFHTHYQSDIGTARSEEQQKCRKENAEVQTLKDDLEELLAWECDAGALVTRPWECHTGGCKNPDGAYATDMSGTVLPEEQCVEPNIWDGEIVALKTKDNCYNQNGQVVDGALQLQCAPPSSSSPPECSTGADTSLYNTWKNSQDTTFCAARGKENNFPTGVCKEGPPQGAVVQPGMEQDQENNFARSCGASEPCDASNCISNQQFGREWIPLNRSSATRDEFYRAMLVQEKKWEKWEPWPRCREQIKWIRETFGDAILTDEEISLHGQTCDLEYIEPEHCSTLLTYVEAKLGHRVPTEEENARRRNLPDHSNSACFTHTTKAACAADTTSGGDGLGCKWNPHFWDSAKQRQDPKCMPALCQTLNPCKHDGRTTYEQPSKDVMDIPSTLQHSGVWECIPRPNRDAACSAEGCDRGSVHQCMMDGLKHGAPKNCCAMHKLDGSGTIV